MRTWAFITSALFFIAAFSAGGSGEILNCALFSL
jgi:hypothetical protein